MDCIAAWIVGLAKFFLQLVQSVAVWPIAALLIAYLLRRELRLIVGGIASFIERIHEVEGKGFKASAAIQERAASEIPAPDRPPPLPPSVDGSSTQQPTTKPPTQTAAPAGIPPPIIPSPVVRTAAQRWNDARLKANADDDVRWMVELLDRRIENESTLNLIFGSQLRLIDDLAARPSGMLIDSKNARFIEHQLAGGVGTVEMWLLYPYGRGLIEPAPTSVGIFKLTPAGEDFVTYVQWAYPVGRPFRVM